jgi:hypothetical protein
MMESIVWFYLLCGKHVYVGLFFKQLGGANQITSVFDEPFDSWQANTSGMFAGKIRPFLAHKAVFHVSGCLKEYSFELFTQ